MRIAVINRGKCFTDRYSTDASGSHSILLEPLGYSRIPTVTDKDSKQTSTNFAYDNQISVASHACKVATRFFFPKILEMKADTFVHVHHVGHVPGLCQAAIGLQLIIR
jgi:hypothetical protein